VADLYATRIAALQESPARHGKIDGEISTELIDSVRALVDRIEVRALGYEEKPPIMVTLHGALAAFLEPDDRTYPQKRSPRVVAGGGFTSTQPSVPLSCRVRI
jgi:hypothetical protein